jgi:hypothetical protein
MAIIEQDEINKLVQEQQQKMSLTLSAKEKLCTMFYSVMGMELEGNELDSIDEITSYMGMMQFEMKPANEYYEDFKRLEKSYNLKITRRY